MDELTSLSMDGVWVGESPPTLSAERIRDAIRLMLLAREVDHRMVSLQRQGRMGTFSSVTGQEATIIGASMAIEVDDWLVPAYREMPAMLNHGYPLVNFMQYWRGNAQAARIPEGVRMLPAQIALAAQLPHAVGLAWGMKLQASDRIVLAFFGDGAASEGDFHEALNLAGVMKAPVVFVLQNNGWAISTPRKKQSAAENLACRAEGYGMPGVLVDGNDLFAVHQAVSEAVTRARSGAGPTLIEASTMRMAAHNTADDDTKYRTDDDLSSYIAADPLNRVIDYSTAEKIIDEKFRAKAEAKVRDQVTEAIEQMELEPTPKREQLFDHVTQSPSPRLLRQREAMLSGDGK